MNKRVLLIGIGTLGTQAIDHMIELGTVADTCVFQDGTLDQPTGAATVLPVPNSFLEFETDIKNLFGPESHPDLQLVVLVGDLGIYGPQMLQISMIFQVESIVGIEVGIMGVLPFPKSPNHLYAHLAKSYLSTVSKTVYQFPLSTIAAETASEKHMWTRLFEHIAGTTDLAINMELSGLQQIDGADTVQRDISDIWGECVADTSLLVGTGDTVGSAFEQAVEPGWNTCSRAPLLSITGGTSDEVNAVLGQATELFGRKPWSTVGNGGSGGPVRVTVFVA
ncbi:MAG: hypothetical protein HQL69_23045 [Magnetococcales bacterium]|nr:hypothetical protein [Magnetococcales bacterium]